MACLTKATLVKPWTGFMLNMLCPKVHSCHLCPESELNLAKRWPFASFIQDTTVIVGLKLLTTGTNVTTMLCATGKKN